MACSNSSWKWSFNPWRLWLKLCRWFNAKISQFFSWLGHAIGNHPLVTITLGLLLLGALTSGFAFMKTENRMQRLYLPEESISVKNLDKAQDYGFYRPTRIAEFIIFVRRGESVLRKECFEDALKLHELVISIPNYQKLCLRKSKSGPLCLTEEPLWIFNYTSNFGNLLTSLNSVPPTGLASERIFGKARWDEKGNLISARALRLVYLIRGVRLDEDVSEETVVWEREFIRRLRGFSRRNLLQCGAVVFNAERSIDDAIQESTNSDVKFVALTFTLMIGFACFMLGKYRNPLTGHGLLAISGVLCVLFGIVAGFGLTMLANIPFVSIVGVLPFLILGVGIDDMFIILDELDRTEPDQTVPERLSAVLKTVGPAITMTTVTDLLAFAVGTTSRFPGVVYFCTFAALSISFTFLFMVTIFVAFMSCDCRRMKAGKRDLVPCFKVPSPAPGAPRWDEPLPQTSNKMMAIWGRLLMKPSTRVLVVLISLSLLSFGIYGTSFVNENMDRRHIAKDGSDFIKFIDVSEEYFKTDIPVDIILEQGINYSDPITQQKIRDLTGIVTSNSFYLPTVRSWFDQLQIWHVQTRKNNSKPLLDSLNQFLQTFPEFRQDIVFAENGSRIEASRFHCFLKMSFSSVELRDGMTSLRNDLGEKSSLPVFINAHLFIYYEQFVWTRPETVRNLILAAAAILVATSLFLVDPLVIMVVLFGFISLIFELLGLMYIWDVSLNSISMINLVMAIGFAVDYSAHIAHAFVHSAEVTPEKRAIDALKTVGASVMMGGFSTFLGMVVTAFASAEVFRIFFRMFFGIVVIGLMHGLCFLPVWMSIFCRHIAAKPEQPEQDDVKNADCTFSITKVGQVRSKDDHAISMTNPAFPTSNEGLDILDLEASPNSPQEMKSSAMCGEKIVEEAKDEVSVTETSCLSANIVTEETPM